MGKRRHYHVEDTDGTPTPPYRTIKHARQVAFYMVTHARQTGLYRSWRIDWDDPVMGYRRWKGITALYKKARINAYGIGDEFLDTITVIPCTDSCLKENA